MCCSDDRNPQCGSQVKANSQHSSHLPCDPYSLRLFSFGPDEIEEKGCAEDESDVDASPDVVGCGSDIVVVVDNNPVVADSLDLALAGGVV